MLSYRQRLPITHPNLACYYQGPKKQLGQFDPATATALVQGGSSIVSGVTNFFSSLFGKDPNKANYDQSRAAIWAEFQRLVGTPQAQGIQTGTTTQTEARSVIAAGDEFLRQYQALTDQYRGLIDASWLEPRYRDLYDFMTKVVNSWKSSLTSLPRGSLFAGSGAGLLESAGSYWPLLAGAAVLFFLGRK